VSQPRLHLVHGRTSVGQSTPSWPSRYDEQARSALPDGPWISWRLLGANNRELGRGALRYPDAARCLEAMLDLRLAVLGGRSTVGTSVHGGLWGWRIDLDGIRVAVAGRLYQRQRECRYNLTQFLAALPAALLPTQPHDRRRAEVRGGVLAGAQEP